MKSYWEICFILYLHSSVQEQKEDLRKRLSCTTHKLEILESEFNSTRQYLEAELRGAQEELEKFTDKLHKSVWCGISILKAIWTILSNWSIFENTNDLENVDSE